MLVNAFREHATAQVDKVTGKLMGSDATSACINENVLKHEVVWKRGKKGQKQLGVLRMHPSIIQRVESAETVGVLLEMCGNVECVVVCVAAFDVGVVTVLSNGLSTIAMDLL